MHLEKTSFCKVNLLLNILGKRPDGFHELETIMQPIAIYDSLRLERAAMGIRLTCSNPALPVDSGNLVYRAAEVFLKAAGIPEGVVLHLEKKIPLAAGVGGGSGNAAAALLGLNELFGHPLGEQELSSMAANLGSDVPFFLQEKPALATGRGENVRPLSAFKALEGKAILLVHPGFGVSTPWAYQNLGRFPEVLNGQPGRAQRLLELLQVPDASAAAAQFYNSLEFPVLEKYPILGLYQEFLKAEGALGTLMSGSGSTTFAIVQDTRNGEQLRERFLGRFGATNWTAVVELRG